jgi:hypothetical protein
MCCQNNNYVIKNNENDLDLFKREVSQNKHERKRTISDLPENEKIEKVKNIRNKEIIDKHMKDSSFKINSSVSKLELQERVKKLEAITNTGTSKNLSLKVHGSLNFRC